MSDVADPAVPQTSAKSSMLRLLLVNLHYIALYVISIWLVAVTDSDPEKAAIQWQLFIPVVALISIIDGWQDTRESKVVYLIQQILHWGALMLVVYLLFLPEMENFLNAESHGFVLAYLLGLAAILSGIYLEWKMAVFGAFLIASAVGIGYLSDNALMLSLIGIAVAGIAITLLIRKHRRG